MVGVIKLNNNFFRAFGNLDSFKVYWDTFRMHFERVARNKLVYFVS